MSNQITRTVVLAIGPAGALSGGDVHAIELVRRWPSEAGAVRMVGPALLRAHLGSDSVALDAVGSPFESRMRTSALALAAGLGWRGARAVRRCRGARAVVASSHLIFDVVPAYVAHLVWRTPVVSYVYHLIGASDRPATLRSRAAVLLERVSLGLLRRADALVFVDFEEARLGLLARGFDASQLVETTNAYDPRTPPGDPRPAAPRRLVFVGRLVPQKGTADLVELGRRLAAAGSDDVIDVLGDGPARAELEAAVRDAGLPNVVVHGFVDDATKWASLAAASLFLAPSREEGWGIAVGEALLAGVPVVAKDLPAYAHFGDRITRSCGTSTESFVETTRAVLDDPERLAALAAAARAGRDTLPRWSEVIAADARTIAARSA